MADRAYGYMDWPKIEGIAYSDERHPKSVLAPKLVREGVLIQGFFPDAKTVRAVNEDTGKISRLKMEDECGWFAAIIPGRKIPRFHFLADDVFVGASYAFPEKITPEIEGEFCAGISYGLYNILGAHHEVCGGTDGIRFAVWAPNAIRVSVVGTFNQWDGRVNPMEYHENSGIYELFIPGLEDGSLYKYELKLQSGVTYLKPDPFGNEFEKRPATASRIADLAYRWHDRNYMKMRQETADFNCRPLAIYELNLSLWKMAEDGSYLTYRELAPKIAEYVIDMGYTHIELMPVMEYPDDDTYGYQTTGYFAPTSRYGSAVDFKFFIDTMHQAGIGVILDWTPGQFSSAEDGLASFDGTCLYEHLDPRQGINPMYGTRLWNYGRPQVRSFLISNAVFWIREYHLDGLRYNDISTILRLDYGRADGQWVANIYGSNENLEGIDFLKHLNAYLKRRYPEVLLIVEEDINWPETTGTEDENHLGFDFKWNLHFTQHVICGFSAEPDKRYDRIGSFTDQMLYNYLEHWIISLSRDAMLFDPQRLYDQMPGSSEEKYAALRAAYTFMIAHPGKKLFTEKEEFCPVFFKDLLKLYRTSPALFEADDREIGFEWIDILDSANGVFSFLRKTERYEDTLVVICNLGSRAYDKYPVGVPYDGQYKEVFNSDSGLYGGTDFVNMRAKNSLPKECDERLSSINVHLAPQTVSIFGLKEEA